jgi:peptide/nickel transport system permease protein
MMGLHKNISFTVAKWVVIMYFIVGLLGPFIANDKPILDITDGKWSMPIWHQNHQLTSRTTDSLTTNTTWSLMPLIPYAPWTMDKANQGYVGPFDTQNIATSKYRHWLGTDKLGRDIAAAMIYGTKTALIIGFISTIFGFMIGVSLGMLGAYFGNNTLKYTVVQLLFGILMMAISTYYLWYEYVVFQKSIFLFIAFFIAAILLISFINNKLLKGMSTTHITIPFDGIIVKIIEIKKSIPSLFLLLSLVSIITKPSVWSIIFIISLLGWIDFARFARAETLVVKEENYITSARILGFDHLRILYRHLLPNIMPTLLVVFCFSVSGAILLESSLSFLGIGLPVDEVSWGKLLAEGRHMRSWWMVVFPGLAIFILILCLNIIASHIQRNNAKSIF